MMTFFNGFGQTPNPPVQPLSPAGLLENVFDNYGNQYSLSDVRFNNPDSNHAGRMEDPNCTSGIFELHFTTGSGEKILSLTLIPKDITLLDLSQYSNGCYFARLENESFNKSLKIIKN